MARKLVPLTLLLAPKGNPRKTAHPAGIEGLAESIKTDGLLHNLVVEPEGEKFRVLAGRRRYLALKHLAKEGDIDGTYKVPVEIRSDLDADQALRIATVENVQREPLDPMDEAEAFAALLQKGAAIEEVAAQTGVSENTVRRRVALAGLAKEVKKAVRSGAISLSLAEAMTLGTAKQQHSILTMIEEGASLDRDDVRDMLLEGKPTAAMAIFPLEFYTGTYTSDLFAEASTTYFDDVEQFRQLQKEAADKKIESYRGTVTFIDAFHLHSVPWWQYREAEAKEEGGVVINLSPSGAVEVREGLVRHEVRPEVAEETRQPASPRKERPAYSANVLRYVACHKSIAVQAALLQNPRIAKEVAAVLLLGGGFSPWPVRVTRHPALSYFGNGAGKPKGYLALEAKASTLSKLLGFSPKRANEAAPWERLGVLREPLEIYAAVKRLKDEDLDALLVLALVLAFGQAETEKLDTNESFFNKVAVDLSVSMRAWWTPDESYLKGLHREELAGIALESGGARHIAKLKARSKSELVESLTRFFERTGSTSKLDEEDAKGRDWLPGTMLFPAQEPPRADS